MVHRIYVEKQPAYAVEANALCAEIASLFNAESIKTLRILNRYDVEGVSKDLFDACVPTVFSEPQVDHVHTELPESDFVIAVEYLPGQYDQRADSAAECIQLISRQARPAVQSAKVYLFSGELSADLRRSIEQYLVNPVDSRVAGLAPKTTLAADTPEPPDVPVVDGFLALEQDKRGAFIRRWGLAMDEADLAFCQAYFTRVGREPTLTELRLIDTYWSDHCRHTTFGTVLDTVTILDPAAQRTYETYLQLREQLYAGRADKPVTLMDMATIGARALKARGLLRDLDQSDEVNACSVHITVDNDGTPEDWLLLFKNETHNHPTEIEPFGGAATCIGGAIRDPLANRGYVFGAMRVTGAGDPLAPLASTLPGKLPQRKLVQTAARGYSSYGNQIGLATGLVRELYHPGYVAKRLETGAVLGAVPLANVVRETPAPGDVVLLVGGRTGRDGCGGATGSSKAHEAESLATCGAEVQKGNPPAERKLQRLFKNPAASRLIRRCNDFGAGGVAVAIGELADGLRVDLSAVPKKYEGLDGTEIAISESQERMAVVVRAPDADPFIALTAVENLEATRVAVVTAEPRLVMDWRGRTIVDIERGFLASNGADKHADAAVGALAAPAFAAPAGESLQQRMCARAGSLPYCGQTGLGEQFDSTIGAASVLLPFGGKYQRSPADAMVLKLPVEGETTTCAGMAFGFDPYVSEQNPYEGARWAVFESVAKLAACGFRLADMHLSFQEYFPRLGADPARWGLPVAALLGALDAQLALGVAAIGGKDSMSGSFEQLDVPPTLISFAVAAGQVGRVVSAQFEAPFSKVVLLRSAKTGALPGAAAFKLVLAQLEQLLANKQALSVRALGAGGLAQGIVQMAMGNRMGLRLNAGFDASTLFEPAFGDFLVELADPLDIGEAVGETTTQYILAAGDETVDLAAVQAAYDATLEPVFPTGAAGPACGDGGDGQGQASCGGHAREAQAHLNQTSDREGQGHACGCGCDAHGHTAHDHPHACNHGHHGPHIHSETHDHASHHHGHAHEGHHHEAHIHPAPNQPDTLSFELDPQRRAAPKIGVAKPLALIPVFPGTNCELDTARALRRAGARAEVFVVRNRTPEEAAQSADALADAIGRCQMLVLPGGFSAGDEPEGSAKLITACFRGAAVAEATAALLEQRDGLVLGICNGFQALVKLGLLPAGRIQPPAAGAPTLTFNQIGRHQSRMVRTRIASALSPWLALEPVGAVHTIPVSHGEGRFVAPAEVLQALAQNGQIAAQYVDFDGQASMDIAHNPNGSLWAVEAISSPDGRVLGKMAHSERTGDHLYLNLAGNTHQQLFEGGVAYFSV